MGGEDFSSVLGRGDSKKRDYQGTLERDGGLGGSSQAGRQAGRIRM